MPRSSPGAARIKQILAKYSNFVGFPIHLNGERVNTVEALWLKNKSDVTEEQYKEFYKFAAHAFDEPRYTFHFNADAPLNINALLFVPDAATWSSSAWARWSRACRSTAGGC